MWPKVIGAIAVTPFPAPDHCQRTFTGLSFLSFIFQSIEKCSLVCKQNLWLSNDWKYCRILSFNYLVCLVGPKASKVVQKPTDLPSVNHSPCIIQFFFLPFLFLIYTSQNMYIRIDQFRLGGLWHRREAQWRAAAESYIVLLNRRDQSPSQISLFFDLRIHACGVLGFNL